MDSGIGIHLLASASCPREYARRLLVCTLIKYLLPGSLTGQSGGQTGQCCGCETCLWAVGSPRLEHLLQQRYLELRSSTYNLIGYVLEACEAFARAEAPPLDL